MRKFKKASLPLTAALIAITACTIESGKGSGPPAAGDDAHGQANVFDGGNLELGQTVDFEFSRAPIPGDLPPYTHGAGAVYQLKVPAAARIALVPHLASSACLDPIEWVGPFVTLHHGNGKTISNDSVRYPHDAVESFEFKADLEKGSYAVEVHFYSTGADCGGFYSLEFKEEAKPGLQGSGEDADGGSDGGNRPVRSSIKVS